MTSPLRFLGIKPRRMATPVPMLSINKAIPQLQLRSEKYFTIPEIAEAKNGDVLAVVIKYEFSLNDDEHLEYLNDSIALYRKYAAQLKLIDYKLLTCVLIGITASVLAFLPLVTYFGGLACIGICYYLYQRGKAYDAYHEALTLLVANCNWALGVSPITDQETNLLTQNEIIRAMMQELYPVLTPEQVEHLIADSIEAIFVREQQEQDARFHATRTKKSGFFSKSEDSNPFAPQNSAPAIKDRSTDFYRSIYGFNQGQPLDLVDAFLAILPDLYKATRRGVEKIQYWWNSPSPAQGSKVSI